MLLGESLRSHRHYDRAVEILAKALDRLPARREDLLFALGRAHFGAERYAEAEKLYLKGAAVARPGDTQAIFYYHASRAAQLLGDDARAEQEMTQAVKVAGPGRPARRPARKPGARKRAELFSPAPLAAGPRVVFASMAPRKRTARKARAQPAPRASPPSPMTAASGGAAALVQRLRTRLAQKRGRRHHRVRSRPRRRRPRGRGAHHPPGTAPSFRPLPRVRGRLLAGAGPRGGRRGPGPGRVPPGPAGAGADPLRVLRATTCGRARAGGAPGRGAEDPHGRGRPAGGGGRPRDRPAHPDRRGPARVRRGPPARGGEAARDLREAAPLP